MLTGNKRTWVVITIITKLFAADHFTNWEERLRDSKIPPPLVNRLPHALRRNRGTNTRCTGVLAPKVRGCGERSLTLGRYNIMKKKNINSNSKFNSNSNSKILGRQSPAYDILIGTVL
ncbi:hypothetical protein F4776DRAFT_602867 [Hypoxylon sp. NC0597]|nr:hypothetical protein F4776DRAFT_602867 [Hypoxylon sp. NC0597]